MTEVLLSRGLFLFTTLLGERCIGTGGSHQGKYWFIFFHLCCILCTALTNVHLLSFVDIWILMDPNGSPLQVINPTNESTPVYVETTGMSLIPCRQPTRTPWLGSLSACLPDSLELSADEPAPVQEQSCKRDQGRNDFLNLTLLNPQRQSTQTKS